MSPAAPVLFLSYNRADSKAAQLIRDYLRGVQVSTFFDTDALPLGLPWMRRIEQSLRESTAIAVLFGPSGLGGFQEYEVEAAVSWQAREAARGRTVSVIPVLLPGCDPEKLGLFLHLYGWLDLRAGLEDTVALSRLVRAVQTPAAEPEAQPPRIELCPYRGLSAFREQDVNLFFGRDKEVAELAGLVSSHPLTALVGASGCGKSSILRGGLFPRLRAGDDPVAPIVTFTPGRDPFDSLAKAVFPYYEPNLEGDRRVGGIKTLAAGLRAKEGADARSLADLAAEIGRQHTRPDGTVPVTLFVADQFEEILTLAPEADREPFLRLLLSGLDHDPPLFRILLSFRLDFQAKLESLHLALTRRIQQSHLKVWPMRREQLREVIVRPADRAGLLVEDLLAERLLDEVEENRDSLPLLEFALAELWKKRVGNRLTAASYQAGDMARLIAVTAEAELKDYPPGSAQERVVRSAMGRLVVVDIDPDKDSRARVPLSDFSQPQQAVILALAKARLVVTSRDSLRGQDVAEVTHEALIRNWQRLAGWIQQDREFLLWRQDFQRDVARDNLLSGALLKKAGRMAKEHRDSLNDAERAFIARSRSAARRWQAVAAAGVLVGLALGGWWWWQRTDSYQVSRVMSEGPALLAEADPQAVLDYLGARTLAGDAKGALEQAQRLGATARYKFQCLRCPVVTAMARMGNFDDALKLAGEIEEDTALDKAGGIGPLGDSLLEVATLLAEQDRFDQALAAARRIREVQLQSLAKLRVYHRLLEKGQRAKAREVGNEAFKSLFAGLDWAFDDGQEPGFRDRMAALKRNLGTWAEQALSEGWEESRNPPLEEFLIGFAEACQTIVNPAMRSLALQQIVQMSASLNGVEGLRLNYSKMIPHLRKSLDGIHGAAERSAALLFVVELTERAGDKNLAKELSTQAMKWAREVEGDDHPRALGAAAAAVAKYLPPGAMNSTWKEALTGAGKIRDALVRSRVLRDLAVQLAKAGPPSEAIVAVNHLSDAQDRAYTQRSIAQTIARSGRPDDALSVARDITDPQERSLALHTVSVAMNKAGRGPEADSLRAESLAAAHDVRSSSLPGLAMSYADALDLFTARRMADEKVTRVDDRLAIYARILLAHARRKNSALKIPEPPPPDSERERR
ncbi:MAG: TIR domain-containing protein [Bryobacteraceae bacterium]|nr:TIR domain-containing protein [Bryobacteraceae bacterium]